MTFIGASSGMTLLAIALGRQIITLDHMDKGYLVKIDDSDLNIVLNIRLLEVILYHIPYNFTSSAVQCFVYHLSFFIVKKPQIAEDLTKFDLLLKLIFDLSVIVEDSVILPLHSLIVKEALKSKSETIWQVMRANGCSLIHLDSVADFYIKEFKSQNEKKNTIIFIKILYVLEDYVNRNNPVETLFIKILWKTLLVLDRLSLLYIDVPELTIFEIKSSSFKRIDSCRDGGILRPLFKLIFHCMKNKIEDSYSLLRYLLFRDKEIKKSKKAALNMKFSSKLSKKEYNLIDLINHNVSKLKLQEERTDFFIREILEKSSLTKQSTSSLFNNKSLLLVYILSQIFQLMCFELTGTLLNDSELNLKEISTEVGNYSIEFIKLTEILVDIIKNIGNSLERIIKREFAELMIELEDKRSAYIKQRGIDLSEEVKDEDQFITLWEMFCRGFIESFKQSNNVNEHCLILASLLLTNNFFYVVQPYVLICTEDVLLQYDKVLTKEVSPSSAPLRPELGEELSKNLSELERRIQDKICYLEVHYKKLAYDEARSELTNIAKDFIKKLMKEQRLEFNVWRDDKEEKYYRRLYAYVSKMYDKLLNRCPLQRKLMGERKQSTKYFKRFMQLRKNRDRLGRVLKLKPIKNIEDNVSDIRNNFGYLAGYTLKKLLILKLANKKQKEDFIKERFMESNFKFKLQRMVFCLEKEEHKDYMMPQVSDNNFKEVEVDLLDAEVNDIPNETIGLQYKGYFPIDIKKYDAEIVTMRGSIFGSVILNADNLTFKSHPYNKSNENYKYGSNSLNLLSRKINKRWKFESIKEIVVKRYNLLRQAIEIYFHNNSSIFLLFFSVTNLNVFLKDYQQMILKRKIKEISLITKPESYFEAAKFKEKWQKGLISNFEYLMLLNKYGGRSFNDLNQYPIFPWILSNYSEPLIDLNEKSNYRNLRCSIGGISEIKRSKIDGKIKVMNDDKDLDIYQLGTHYMAGRMALGYLFRAEPFSSILLHFEKGRDSPSRMFQAIGHTWKSGIGDTSDNKELVPELFYLPDILQNYNSYSYGTRLPDIENIEFVMYTEGRLRVDQVIIPRWANNPYEFLKLNSLALESKFVCLEIGKWIDLIFGVKQQSKEDYNVYKNLCDEEYVRKHMDNLNESKMIEIQEFGTNPIKLFNKRHPVKEEKMLEPLDILKIKEFGECIMTIKNYSNNIYILLKDNTIAILNKKELKKQKMNVKCQVMKLTSFNNTRQDLKQILAFLENQTIITCGYYDKSCRVMSISNDTTTRLSVHKADINVIYAVDSLLFTGTKDGALECWDIKHLNRTLKWSLCDLSESIITLDANEDLDVIVVGGVSGLLSLRTITSGRFICLVNPVTLLKERLKLKLVRLSYRGYIVAVLSSINNSSDRIVVMTINGALIATSICDYKINSIVIDELGYNLIAGGSNSKLLTYDLITLRAKDTITRGQFAKLLTKEDIEITDIELVKEEEIIVIGTTKGELYSGRYN